MFYGSLDQSLDLATTTINK